MANERDNAEQNDIIEPEDVNSSPVSASPSTPESADPVDPADEIPVPIAMSAAEIDERAQAVDAVRGKAREPESRDSDDRMEA
jgi:hypothetical protein